MFWSDIPLLPDQSHSSQSQEHPMQDTIIFKWSRSVAVAENEQFSPVRGCNFRSPTAQNIETTSKKRQGRVTFKSSDGFDTIEMLTRTNKAKRSRKRGHAVSGVRALSLTKIGTCSNPGRKGTPKQVDGGRDGAQGESGNGIAG